VVEQAAHFPAGIAVVERGDQPQRLAQQAHVLLQLGLEGVVEHDATPSSRQSGGRARAARGNAPAKVGVNRNRLGLAGVVLAGGNRLRFTPTPAEAGWERGMVQILPTRSSDGVRVLSPSFHLAGHTSFGWAAVNWAAFSLRRVSETSRAISLEWISRVLITPSGLITKVPRRARPSSAMCTPKALVSWWVGSPTSGNLALPTAGEVSCHTLCEKCVSVVTMYTSAPAFWNSA